MSPPPAEPDPELLLRSLTALLHLSAARETILWGTPPGADSERWAAGIAAALPASGRLRWFPTYGPTGPVTGPCRVDVRPAPPEGPLTGIPDRAIDALLIPDPAHGAGVAGAAARLLRPRGLLVVHNGFALGPSGSQAAAATAGESEPWLPAAPLCGDWQLLVRRTAAL